MKLARDSAALRLLRVRRGGAECNSEAVTKTLYASITLWKVFAVLKLFGVVPTRIFQALGHTVTYIIL
jgi:hypothetical protein